MSVQKTTSTKPQVKTPKAKARLEAKISSLKATIQRRKQRLTQSEQYLHKLEAQRGSQ